MASAHGFKGVFKLDDAAGTLTDITQYLRDVKLDQEARLVERTITGVPAYFELGHVTGVILLDGVLDAAIINQIQALWDTSAEMDELRDFEFGPQGSATGAVKLTGTCRPATFHIGTPIDDAGSWKATLQLSDNKVTAGTYS